jgi:hypothetical protein
MPYRPLDIPYSDHRDIRTSRAVQEELKRIGDEIAAEACQISDVQDGYEANLAVGNDRARVFVGPVTAQARVIEAKKAPLLQIAAAHGAHNDVTD